MKTKKERPEKHTEKMRKKTNQNCRVKAQTTKPNGKTIFAFASNFHISPARLFFFFTSLFHPLRAHRRHAV
jgi:hypothetical protein